MDNHRWNCGSAFVSLFRVFSETTLSFIFKNRTEDNPQCLLASCSGIWWNLCFLKIEYALMLLKVHFWTPIANLIIYVVSVTGHKCWWTWKTHTHTLNRKIKYHKNDVFYTSIRSPIVKLKHLFFLFSSFKKNTHLKQ